MVAKGPHRWARRVAFGLATGAGVLFAHVALARAVSSFPPGTRAQAVGAALATLTMLVAGLALGVINRRMTGIPKGQDAAQALAEAGWTRAAPHVAALVASLVLLAFGQAGLHVSAAGELALGGTLEAGSVGRAILAVDATGLAAFVLIDLGAALSTHAGPGWPKNATLGLVLLVGLQLGGAQLAGRWAWHPEVAEPIIVASTVISFLLAGLAISVLARRLAFVELVLVALAYGYLVYFAIGIFGGGLLSRVTIPEQQILIVLALVPAALSICLLAVGSSIGFLLFGGGRLDAGFGFELMMGLRYLRLRLTWPVVAIGVLSPLAGFLLSGSQLVGAILTVPLLGLFWVVRHARNEGRAPIETARSQGFFGATLVISILGVCLGVMAPIVVLSVMNGFEEDLKTKILGTHAHLAVTKKGDDFVEYEELKERLLVIDGVQVAAPFVLGEGMVSSESGLSGTLVKGIDPTDTRAAADLGKSLIHGKLEHLLHPDDIPGARRTIRLEADPSSVQSATGTPSLDDFSAPILSGDLAPTTGRVLPGIIIGRELARSLRVSIGDAVNLVSPVSDEIGPTGPQPKLRRFRVAAVFYSGMYEFDSKLTYLEMKQAQRFFGLRGKATGIELRVKDLDEVGRISEEVKRRVGGYPFSVKDWRETNKELFSALLLEKLAMFIILIFIVLVASFLIVSTLVMIVLEKGREIAILKSMGATDASIMKLFVVQGLTVGFGGASLGLFGGVGLCLLIQRFGIGLDPDAFYITRLPVVMSWTEIGLIVASAMVIAYLASVYPAMAAAKLSPVEGLRDE